MRYPPVPTRWNGTCHERQCTGCMRFLPRDIAHFYKDAGKPDGLSSRCVECVRPAMRERMRAAGEKPRYDGTWRPEPGKTLPTIPADRKPVVRFKSPQGGATAWVDLVKGPISFDNTELDDLVIARPDGTPTYNFCVVVDDMIDTGRTIVKAAEALVANGAIGVVVAATHAVFSPPAVARLSSGAVDEVIVTNTLPITADKQFANLTVLSIAPLIAAAISAVFGDDSVNSLFPGHA